MVESIASSTVQLQCKFLRIMSRIEQHARIYFRDIKCAVRKADCVAETLALCWKWFVGLAQKGKDAAQFASAMATLAARSVRCGRRLCGQETINDVLSLTAQQRRHFDIESFAFAPNRYRQSIYSSPSGQHNFDAYAERLHDNMVTPPPDAAAFRIDFPQFLAKLSQRDRKMALFLSMGHNAKTVASKFGVTQGRVTQVRQKWCQEWRACQGDLPQGSKERDREMRPADLAA